jgi:hypothetical protein
MSIDVEIAVHGFRGAISAFVEAEDLQNFLTQLRAMNVSLTGAAELRPREEQFVLKLQADGLGHVNGSGTAWSRATYENRLQFELSIDQTFLAEPIYELETVLRREGDDV